MSFDLDTYGRRRPFLYHLTARENLAGIRADRRLRSAAALLAAAKLQADIRVRRRGPKTISVSGRDVVLRDQNPLSEGAIAYIGGYQFADVVELLNRRVFFWAGGEDGPAGRAKGYGWRHFETYRDELPAILRIDFVSLMRANPDKAPLFCQYNSGAPRCSAGHKSTGCKVPRGPDTFRSAHDFPLGIGEVAEVTFVDHVELPPDARFASEFSGPWKTL